MTNKGYIFRKVIHFLLNSLFAIMAIALPANWVVPITIFAFFVVALVELIRLRTKAKKLVNTAFNPVLKKEEGLVGYFGKLLQSCWLLLSRLLYL
jgi:hypothetical protein